MKYGCLGSKRELSQAPFSMIFAGIARTTVRHMPVFAATTRKEKMMAVKKYGFRIKHLKEGVDKNGDEGLGSI
jgi:hypothetical protein